MCSKLAATKTKDWRGFEIVAHVEMIVLKDLSQNAFILAKIRDRLLRADFPKNNAQLKAHFFLWLEI